MEELFIGIVYLIKNRLVILIISSVFILFVAYIYIKRELLFLTIMQLNINNFIQVLDTRIDFLTIFLVSLFLDYGFTNFFVAASSRKKVATKGSGKTCQ